MPASLPDFEKEQEGTGLQDGGLEQLGVQFPL